MQGYTSTFTFVEGEAPGVTEVAWNEWVNGLIVRGYEPSEEPIRWNENNATYALIAIKKKKIKREAVG